MNILMTPIPAYIIFWLSLLITIGTLLVAIKEKSYITTSRVFPLVFLSINYYFIWRLELPIEMARITIRLWLGLFLLTEFNSIIVYFFGQYFILNGNNKKWNHKTS